MLSRNAPALVLALATASGCVSQAQWTPTVDTYGSSRAQFVTRDQQECRQLAMQVSGHSGQQAVRGAATGGLLGAAAGAAIGAAAGSAGRGAAVGAGVGGVGGGVRQGMRSDAAFQRAFNDCMRNRGHTVLS
jgi:outer membrane lipoprotein SlyB